MYRVILKTPLIRAKQVNSDIPLDRNFQESLMRKLLKPEDYKLNYCY